jgi:DNA polymerase-3 subunit gamma/tau
MSYLVIARKWRPALFDEIVGQGHVTRTLKNAISTGRIAHAYLFSGPRGVGKTTAARILAKAINCEAGPTPAPCNKCRSCASIGAGSSVDVLEIDGASNTGVDNVRELRESVKYVPAEARYKVYIIDEVHMLSGPAFNALLKTLEEPPRHVVFIFATTEPHKIPATILSRCQRFDFRRIPFAEIKERIGSIVSAEGFSVDEKALFLIAREADGSLRDSQSLLEQVLAFSDGHVTERVVSDALGFLDTQTMNGLTESVIAKDGEKCLNIVENIFNFGYDLKRVCADLLKHLRDLLVIKVTGDTKLLDLPDAELERLKEIAKTVAPELLHSLFDAVSRGYEDVSRSAYPRYSLEMTLLGAMNGTADAGSGPREATAEGRKPSARPPATQASQSPAKDGRQNAHGPAPAVLRAEEASTGYPSKDRGDGDKAGDSAVNGAIAFIRAKNARLADALKDAVMAIKDGAVDIAVNGRAGLLFIKKDELERLFSEHMKRPVKVNVRSTDAEARGREPLITSAVKILGGRIIEDKRRTNV